MWFYVNDILIMIKFYNIKNYVDLCFYVNYAYNINFALTMVLLTLNLFSCLSYLKTFFRGNSF